MNRRTLLAAVAAASTGLGGCVGEDSGPPAGDNGDGNGDDDDNDDVGDGDGGGGDSEDTESPGGDAPDESLEEDETPRDGEGGEETDAPSEPGPVSKHDFIRTDECDEPGTASVEFLDGAVTVEGCVVGRNGCEKAALAFADYEDDAFVVAVETVEEDGAATEGGGASGGEETDSDGDLCTQALTHLGYAFRASFDGAAPRAVRVVHDDANGRETVATAERDT